MKLLTAIINKKEYKKLAIIALLLALCPLLRAVTIETSTGRIYENAQLIYKTNQDYVGVRSGDTTSLLKVSTINPFTYTNKNGVKYRVKLVKLNIDSVEVLVSGKRRRISFNSLDQEHAAFFGFDPEVIAEYRSFLEDEKEHMAEREASTILYRIANYLHTGNDISPKPRASTDTIETNFFQSSDSTIHPDKASAATSDGPLSSVVFLKSKNDMNGTGFFAYIMGQKLLVTNAHVFCKMVSPRMYNADGLEFQVEKALISQNRDLVLIKVTDCHGIPALPLSDNVAEESMNSKVVVYGDSMGAGVFTEIEGRLLGIGFDIIETDAKYVPGNSGSPIILRQTGKVIGVATYARMTTYKHWSVSDTRFSAGNKGKNIRRFGYRVDNIDLKQFDIYDEAINSRELNTFAKIEQQYNRLYNSKLRKSAWEKQLLACYSYVLSYKNKQWAYTYFQNEYAKVLKGLEEECDRRGLRTPQQIARHSSDLPTELDATETGRKLLRELSKQIVRRKIKTECCTCRGRGSHYERHITDMITCRDCRGKKFQFEQAYGLSTNCSIPPSLEKHFSTIQNRAYPSSELLIDAVIKCCRNAGSDLYGRAANTSYLK